MLNKLYAGFKKSTFFEKLLLVVGLSIAVIGFWLINKIFNVEPILSYDILIVTFLWFLLIFVVILTASNESIKGDLSIIIKEHIEETRLIKEEIRILNNALARRKR
jgi:hypothetical protein